jgi:hypothetical protein
MRWISAVVVAFTLIGDGDASGGTQVACEQGDEDGDGICDDRDPCRNPEPRTLREPRVTLAIRGETFGDGTVRFSGILPVFDEAPADPAATGMRLVLREGIGDAGRVVADVAVPAGSPWIVPSTGKWSYRDSVVVEGIHRAAIKEVTPLPAYQARRAYAVSVEARSHQVGSVGGAAWHQVTLILDAEAPTSRCADQMFRPHAIDPAQEWQLWDGRCKLSRTGTTLRCRSGRVRRPCFVSLAVDEMRCFLADFARGQEAYRAVNGSYCWSDCGALSSIPRPAYVTWLSMGTSSWFQSMAAHAAAPGMVCRWKSDETPNLGCRIEY